MPDVLKTVVDELLVHEHAGRAAEVRAINDHLLLRIERVQSMFQVLEMDRTGNTFGAKHPVIQTIDQLEVLAAIQLFLPERSNPFSTKISPTSVLYLPPKRNLSHLWQKR